MAQRANDASTETRGGTMYARDETERHTKVAFRMLSPHRTKGRRITMDLESSCFIVDNKETLVEVEATEDGVHDVSWCRIIEDISEIRV